MAFVAVRKLLPEICPVCETACGFDPREGLCEELLRLTARQHARDQAYTEVWMPIHFRQGRRDFEDEEARQLGWWSNPPDPHPPSEPPKP